jgi:FkbM family methyltransferase
VSRLRALRSIAGAGWRRLHPTPEEAAWQEMCAAAERVPRRTPGRIALLGYEIEYVDLLSTCPQWHDLFVHQHLRFTARTDSPRILDCGANIGLASLAFKRQHPRARVTAFEADPSIAEVASRNLRMNGADDVECVAAAVWSASGTLDFQAEGTDSGSVRGLSAGLDAGEKRVRAVRLRDWIAVEPVDLVKIDIEGAELEVLRDCEDVLDRVGAVHMEVHDFMPGQRLLPECLGLLERAGFVTALGSLLPVNWRPVAASGSPFAGAPPIWLVTVRAWRRDYLE